ncbi:hypothetical protein Tco_0639967 [Tanacetum coccineum]
MAYDDVGKSKAKADIGFDETFRRIDRCSNSSGPQLNNELCAQQYRTRTYWLYSQDAAVLAPSDLSILKGTIHMGLVVISKGDPALKLKAFADVTMQDVMTYVRSTLVSSISWDIDYEARAQILLDAFSTARTMGFAVQQNSDCNCGQSKVLLLYAVMCSTLALQAHDIRHHFIKAAFEREVVEFVFPWRQNTTG